jgi:hypothetical protein
MPHHTHQPAHATTPLPPPTWATRSIPEDGGVTHEIVSGQQPLIKRWRGNGTHLDPTEVSLSITDTPADGRWVRAAATVQIEGGSYPLDSIRQLRDALDEFLRVTARDSAPDPLHAP